MLASKLVGREKASPDSKPKLTHKPPYNKTNSERSNEIEPAISFSFPIIPLPRTYTLRPASPTPLSMQITVPSTTSRMLPSTMLYARRANTANRTNTPMNAPASCDLFTLYFPALMTPPLSTPMTAMLNSLLSHKALLSIEQGRISRQKQQEEVHGQ